MQTTLLGLAIALIIALVAALIGPFFVDWNQYRPQFELEASRIVGTPVRVRGALDARLLPTPTLRLRGVEIGDARDRSKVRADRLDVEFSLGSLMRGDWRANEVSMDGFALDLGLDGRGHLDGPSGSFNLGSLSIDRLNITGRINLHDAASNSSLALDDFAFSGDLRAQAGTMRGDGRFKWHDVPLAFRVAAGPTADDKGTRVRFASEAGDGSLPSSDIDGVLTFEAREPRFEGAFALMKAARDNASLIPSENNAQPLRIASRLKVNPVSATFEQLEVSYGAADRALKFTGAADVRFGASPRLEATLSSRQLDADRVLASTDTPAGSSLLTMAYGVIASLPRLSIPADLDLGAELITFRKRPVQNVAVNLRSDGVAWHVDRLDLQAPGATRIKASGIIAQSDVDASFRGPIDVESGDPDLFLTWVQGRNDVTTRLRQPMKFSGDLTFARDRIVLDSVKANLNGDTVAGRIVSASSGFEAELKADRFNLDWAAEFANAVAGPRANWPDQVRISIDVAHATLTNRQFQPVTAQVTYGPQAMSLDRLKIVDANGVMLEGAGTFDRKTASGRLSLKAATGSLAQLGEALSPVAPAFATRLMSADLPKGEVSFGINADIARSANNAGRLATRALLDIDAAAIKGAVVLTATPDFDAIQKLDIAAISRTDAAVEAKLSSNEVNTFLRLLGLNGIVAAQGPVQADAAVNGAWGAPLRFKVKASGATIDAEITGDANPWSEEPKAAADLVFRRVNFAPLFGIGPSRPLDISMTSRLALAGSKLTFSGIDGVVGGSRVRGRLEVMRGDEFGVDGEVGTDVLDVSAAGALALGAAGRDSAEPLGPGWLQGWRGRLAFQALRAVLPGGSELKPFSGELQSNGQTLTLNAIQARLGGGDVKGNVTATRTAAGTSVNARLELANVEGSSLTYRRLAAPAGRATAQFVLTGAGRSASALAGSLSGTGSIAIERARISGLRPDVFAVVARTDDLSRTNDTALKSLVEATLAAGELSVDRVEIPFNVKDGRLTANTAFGADYVKAAVSGGYDLTSDQVNIRVNLMAEDVAMQVARPEIQLLLFGTPDGLQRNVDVSSLSSWLALRAIENETHRLNQLEREGTQKPPDIAPLPPAQPNPSEQGGVLAAPTPNIAGNNPQVTPLPPPITIKPAPGAIRQQRPRPPMVLTPGPSSLQ